MSRSVTFINGDDLWDLVEKHLPTQAVWQKLEEVRSTFAGVDPDYLPRISLEPDGTHVTVVEKYPGAFEQKPLNIRATFVFPDTPEGNKAKEALDNHVLTGAPIDIPAEYVKSLELPELMNKLIGPTHSNEFDVRMGTVPNPQPMLVRVNIQCDDGD